jgi:adenosylcobinamide-GDP ribazoletransferase
MRNLISFFTRIPINGDLNKTRREIWLLPVLGLVTAFIPSLILYFNFPLRGVLSVIALYFFTGLIHLDGLSDFADGVMVKGNREDKIRAMKGVEVGTAGIFALTSVVILQMFALATLPFWALLVAEINSKMSMMIMLSFKKPLGNGLGSYFMEAVTVRKLLLSFIVYLALMAIFSVFYKISVISVVSLVMALYIARISLKNFGGINGDCIGASAELTRAFSLIICTLGNAQV